MPQTHLNEAPRVATWIRAVLEADGTLTAAVTGVYQSIAPMSTDSPYVAYTRAGGVDLMGMGASRVFANDLWTVKAVGLSGSDAVLTTIADRIDVDLHGLTGTTTDGAILGCNRENIVAYDEVVDGVLWTHLGGTYRVYAQPLTGA